MVRYSMQRIAEAEAVNGIIRASEPPAKPSRAFERAMQEFRQNRTAPIRAYYGLIPHLQWGPCVACEQIGFLGVSSLGRGLTCSACEADFMQAFDSPGLTDAELEAYAAEVAAQEGTPGV